MDAEDEDALHYEMEEEEKKVTVHETVFSRVLRDSTPRFVGPSVRHTSFSGFLRFMASPLMPKWSSDLKYGPCPPARDWGSRVSGLVKYRYATSIR